MLKKRRGNNRPGHGQSILRLFLTSSRKSYFPCLQNPGLKMVGWEATMTHKHMNFCTEVNPSALLLCSWFLMSKWLFISSKITVGSAHILKVSAHPKILLPFTHQYPKVQVLNIFYQFLLLSSQHFLLRTSTTINFWKFSSASLLKRWKNYCAIIKCAIFKYAILKRY